MMKRKTSIKTLAARLGATLALMLLTTATAWAWTGSGTSDAPYQIANKTDLETLRNNVNGGTNYDNVYFKQTADITLSGAWTPIGTESHPFKGHYDGGGFAIRGLQVTGNYTYAGLFGYVASGDYDSQQGFYRQAELKDINIVDCNINVGSVSDSWAGGIAGSVNTVLMSGCRVSGSITGYGNACGLTSTHATSGVSVTDCFVDVTVSGTGNQYNQYITPKVYQMIYTGAGTGGGSGNYYHDNGSSVAVSNSTSINNSATQLYTLTGVPSGVTVAETNATLTHGGKHYFASGATATLTIDDASKAFSTFSVSGATYSLAADRKSATVTLASSDATVSATLQTITGSCGTNATWMMSDTNSDGTYETLTISGSGAINSSPWATDFASTIERVNISSADLTITGNPFSTLGSGAVIVVPTPAYAVGYSSAAYASKLRVALGSYLFTATNQGGTAAYAITSEADLRLLSAYVNGGTKMGSGKTFVQTANITMTDGNFTPIGKYYSGQWCFCGTYDGQGHTISGLTVSGSDNEAGLFGSVMGGTVKNVRLISPSVSSSYQYACVGTVVGYTRETHVENCWVYTPTVSATGSEPYVGAIIGRSIRSTDVLTNLYFYDNAHDYAAVCDINGGTVTNVGRARKVTLGSGVTIESPAATSLEYGFVYNTETYYREGVTLTLPNNAPAGYVTVYSANGTSLGGNTYTVNSTDGDVTLAATGQYAPITYNITYNLNGGTFSTDKNSYTVESDDITLDTPTRTGYTFLGWYANEGLTGDPVTAISHGSTGNVELWAKWGISYIDADGNTQYRNSATVLTSGTNVSNLSAGWYVVREDVSYNSRFRCGSGDIHLILCDGAKMTVTDNNDAISLGNGRLTIYAQSTGSSMGRLEATSSKDYGIFANGNVTICGGQISATGANGFNANNGNITICGGQISATGDFYGFYANNGNITLGLRNATDYIYAKRYRALNGTINVRDGQTLTDGNTTYSGTLGESLSLSGRTFYRYIETLDLAANEHDGNYWTTFYCGHTGYKIDEGENACAYTAEYDGAKSQLTLHKLGKVIPKNTAVILVGDDNEISMSASTDDAENSVGNDLHGVDVRKLKSTLGDGTFYVLSKKNGDFGFFEYTGAYMPARKAYLLVSGSNARSLKMTFEDEGETTSLIENGEWRIENSGAWFTLDGRKLDKQPTTKGLYIHNGKKTVIK